MNYNTTNPSDVLCSMDLISIIYSFFKLIHKSRSTSAPAFMFIWCSKWSSFLNYLTTAYHCLYKSLCWYTPMMNSLPFVTMGGANQILQSMTSLHIFHNILDCTHLELKRLCLLSIICFCITSCQYNNSFCQVYYIWTLFVNMHSHRIIIMMRNPCLKYIIWLVSFTVSFCLAIAPKNENELISYDF